MRASLTRLAVALALAVSLAGCGGANPKPSPVVESSATPSPSGAPTMPAEAKGTSPEAAKAFVRHYLTVFTYAANSGDVAALKELGSPDCKSCNGVLKTIEDIYAAGGHAAGLGYSANDMEVDPNPKGFRVTVMLTSATQELQTASASAIETIPPNTTEADFDLNQTAGDWLIEQWTRR